MSCVSLFRGSLVVWKASAARALHRGIRSTAVHMEKLQIRRKVIINARLVLDGT
jgi:hypothetical protein